MNALKQMSAALVLGLAGGAAAQAPVPAPAPGGAWPSAEQQRRRAQEAQPAAPASPQQAGAGKTLSEEQRKALGELWMINQHHASVEDLAKARGASAEVKKYANMIQSGHRNDFAPNLTNLLKQRGVDPASLPQPPQRQQLEQEAKQLSTLSGPQFDRALVSFMKRHGEEFVDACKRARDTTPGSDPDLKQFLDRVEDSEEIYLTEARKLDSAQVQGRTPPAR